MGQITLIKHNGAKVKLFRKEPFCTVTNAVQNFTLMGDDSVQLTIISSEIMDFWIGDKILIGGDEYSIRTKSTREIIGETQYTYEVAFYGVMYELMKSLYRNTDANGKSSKTTFDLTYTLADFVKVIIYNVSRDYPGLWQFDADKCPDTEPITFQFSKQNCLQVLQNVCKEFGYEFRIDQVNGVRIIRIGKFGTVVTPPNGRDFFEWGKGAGLYKLKEQKVDDKSVITRLWVEGGTRNIRSGYREFSDRLQLPIRRLNNHKHILADGTEIPAISEYIGISSEDKRYLEDVDLKNKLGSIEDVEQLDEIYPKRTGEITALGSDVYSFVDDTMDFDLTEKDAEGTRWLINGNTAKITFITGRLAGQEFELKETGGYVHSTRTFSIIKYTDERGLSTPSEDNEAFRFQVGDKYKITDINLPDSYVNDAEEDLWYAGYDKFLDRKQIRAQYVLTFDRSCFINSLPDDSEISIFRVGDYVPVKDKRFNLEKNIRIQKLSRNLLLEHDYTLTISDITTVSVQSQIVQDVLEHNKIIDTNRLKDVNKARRGWRTTEELRNMVYDTDGYFDAENIKPNSIDTNMLTVGSKSQQFILVDVVLEANVNGLPNRFDVTAGKLVHLSLDEQEARVWNMAAARVTLAEDGGYYVYAKCSKVGSNGIFYITQEQLKVEIVTDPNSYYFQVGIIGSLHGSDNFRDFNTTYGFTRLNGNTITTGKIKSSGDGYTYFDLDKGEIGGVIRFKSSDGYKYVSDELDRVDQDIIAANAAAVAAHLAATEANERVAQEEQNRIEAISSINSDLSNIQDQIDGVVENWFYDYAPTTSNFPANTWTTDADKSNHVGDTFTSVAEYPDSSAGKSWRWTFTDSQHTGYHWHPIADSDAVKALQEAAKALSTADGKSTTYLSQPTKYRFGDLWILSSAWSGYKKGDILTASTSRANFNASDWSKSIRYTDDTKALLAEESANTANALLSDMANDNKITADEKSSAKKEWDVIVSEKPKNEAQAGLYGVSTTNYTAQYNALNGYITPLLLDLSTTSDISGSEFRGKFQGYYNARQDLLGAISLAAKNYVEGRTAYVLNLSLDNVSIPCDQMGNPLVALPTTYVSLYMGTTLVTEGVTWDKVIDGMTITSGPSMYTVTSLTKELATLKIKAKIEGKIVATATFTVSKVLAGADGQTPIIMELVPEHAAINRSGELFTPAITSCNAKLIVGGESEMVLKENLSTIIGAYSKNSSNYQIATIPLKKLVKGKRYVVSFNYSLSDFTGVVRPHINGWQELENIFNQQGYYCASFVNTIDDQSYSFNLYQNYGDSQHIQMDVSLSNIKIEDAALEYKGRNLYEKTDSFINIPTICGETTSDFEIARLSVHSPAKFFIGQKYTLTVKAKVKILEKGANGRFGYYIDFMTTTPDGWTDLIDLNNHDVGDVVEVDRIGIYTIQKFLVVMLHSMTFNWFAIRCKVEITTLELKFEKGTEATPYSPAPEDAVLTLNGAPYTTGSPYTLQPDDGELQWALSWDNQSDTERVPIIRDGKDGKDGAYTQLEYKVSALKPSGTGSATPPTVPSGQFLWMRTGKVTPPSSVVWSDYVQISGERGQSGVDGQKQPYYDYQFGYSTALTTTSATTEPTPTPAWADTPPNAVQGQYLWQKVTYYSVVANNWIARIPKYSRLSGVDASADLAEAMLVGNLVRNGGFYEGLSYWRSKDGIVRVGSRNMIQASVSGDAFSPTFNVPKSGSYALSFIAQRPSTIILGDEMYVSIGNDTIGYQSKTVVLRNPRPSSLGNLFTINFDLVLGQSLLVVFNSPLTTAYITDVRLNYKKDIGFTPHKEDTPRSTIYLTEAIKESTSVDGGLINSSLMILGSDSTERAGIDGTSGEVGLFLGGSYQDAVSDSDKGIEIATRQASTMLRKDGAGHFAGGKLRWDEKGNARIAGLNVDEYGLSSGQVFLYDKSVEDFRFAPSVAWTGYGTSITNYEAYKHTVRDSTIEFRGVTCDVFSKTNSISSDAGVVEPGLFKLSVNAHWNGDVHAQGEPRKLGVSSVGSIVSITIYDSFNNVLFEIKKNVTSLYDPKTSAVIGFSNSGGGSIDESIVVEIKNSTNLRIITKVQTTIFADRSEWDFQHEEENPDFIPKWEYCRANIDIRDISVNLVAYGDVVAICNDGLVVSKTSDSYIKIKNSGENLQFIAKGLPTSPTGLQEGEVYNHGGSLVVNEAMPAASILCGYLVHGDRTIAKRYGVKAKSKGDANKNGTGRYSIPHDIGHSNYIVNINPQWDTTAIASVVNTGANSVEIAIVNYNGMAIDCSFHITMIG